MTPEPLRIFASAPVRLDFAGGWTDVAPFATQEGGLVVNAAIDLRASVELTRPSDTFRIHCADSNATATLHNGSWLPENQDLLEFQQAAVRYARPDFCNLITSSDAPRGSGLGGSGALGIALLAAFDAARGIHREPAALAEAAFDFEAGEAAIPGGRQDQYAAALGGFNRLAFSANGTNATRLTLDRGFLDVLLQHTVVCYTGVSRVSGNTISRVMGAYSQGNSQVTGALRAMVDLAHAMTEALNDSNLVTVGRLLSRNWDYQQQLDPQMQTPAMAQLESAMIHAGLMGAKAAGAGAGGSMIFLVKDRATAVLAAAECGARLIPFAWAEQGVVTERK